MASALELVGLGERGGVRRLWVVEHRNLVGTRELREHRAARRVDRLDRIGAGGVMTRSALRTSWRSNSACSTHATPVTSILDSELRKRLPRVGWQRHPGWVGARDVPTPRRVVFMFVVPWAWDSRPS